MSGKRYVVDQAVVWSPGLYRYTRINRDKARHWLEHERGRFHDRVADGGTRRHIGAELGRELNLRAFLAEPRQSPVPPFVLEPGDVALVVRRSRAEAAEEAATPVGAEDWEYGLLTGLDPEKHGPGL
ncbi:MAG: hypothetical protein GWN84_22850 [Gammaproteobacteria bacterium]|nr:hypothetical protein [Gammaproteobacteria bacterium]NIR85448.1 hypothetical protein [Gammaproteobacteria bacterium]NIR89500.1 hypothetical protein [Gammaproteobacteria bacterium]NIU06585.1 hypothetical protein [Gammaproteobacteria bacterium]NIV53468.1 hypothetical protein [Gammaproteobacteria bacterium]